MIQQLYKSLLREPNGVFFDGEDNDEDVKYVLRRSFLVNIGWIALTIVLLLIQPFILLFLSNEKYLGVLKLTPAFSLVLGIFWFTITFAYFFQNFLNWYFNVYIITNKKIIDFDFKGLLYKNVSETPLVNIEDITSNVSGTFGLLFNIGNIYIQTAAEMREFEFESIANPSKVRDIISDIVTDAVAGNRGPE